MEKNFHLYGWIPGRYLRIAELFDECEEGNWNKTEVLNSGKLEVEFSNGYGFALSGFPDPLEKWKNFQPRSIERGNPLTGEGRKERGRRGKNEISNGAKVEKSKGNGKKFVIARENSSEFDKNLPGTSIGPYILGKLRVPCTGFFSRGRAKTWDGNNVEEEKLFSGQLRILGRSWLPPVGEGGLPTATALPTRSQPHLQPLKWRCSARTPAYNCSRTLENVTATRPR